jgi:hypothetical protein
VPLTDALVGHHATVTSTPRVAFAFCDGDLSVHRTLQEAADFHEIYDLGRSSFFAEDGTVIEASADGYRVLLRVTDSVERTELLPHLRDFAERAGMPLDTATEDDPMAYARAFRAPGWHRRGGA